MSDKMPIENLPGYLRNLQETGSVGSSPAPVVGMGNIVVERSYKWTIVSIASAMLMFVVLGVGGMMTYNSMSTEHMTVIMDVSNPQAISQIVADSGGEILSVKQTEGSTYEVKVATRKDKHTFLEWLRGNRDVMKAELED